MKIKHERSCEEQLPPLPIPPSSRCMAGLHDGYNAGSPWVFPRERAPSPAAPHPPTPTATRGKAKAIVRHRDQILAEAARVALGEIGVTELAQQDNRGTKVDRYIRAVRLEPPQPWCGAFVAWSIQRAANKSGYDVDVRQLASTYKARRLFGARLLRPLRGTQAEQLDIRPGDVVLFHRTARGQPRSHLGIVLSYNPKNGQLQTVEGNVKRPGTRGSRGTMVRKKTYSFEDIVAQDMRFGRLAAEQFVRR